MRTSHTPSLRCTARGGAARLTCQLSTFLIGNIRFYLDTASQIVKISWLWIQL